MSSFKLYNYLIRIIIGAVILQIIAFYNGYPLVYSDTGTYIYSGFDLFVPKDRPILYGLLIRLFSFKESLWGVVFFQNLITSFLLFEVIRFFVKQRLSYFFYFSLGILVIGTSIGWYSNQIMPDFFAPILILSWVWILFDNNSSIMKRCLVWTIFLVACCTHFSHLFLSTLLLTLLLIAKIPIGKKRFLPKLNFHRKKMISLFVLVFLSWILLPGIHATFGGGFKISKGSHVFLVAHLNEKGILKQVLDKHCETGKLMGSSLCKEKDGLPQSIDQFIWTGDFLERHGGWKDSKNQFDEIVTLSLKDPEFLTSNIYYSFVFGLSQLPRVGTGEGLTAYIEHSAPYGQILWRFPHELNAYMNSKQNAYGGVNLNFDTINIFHILIILLSVFFLFYLACGTSRIIIPSEQISLIYFVVISVVCNSFVTAGLSAPYSRYQSRVIWLIPFVALLLLWIHRKELFRPQIELK